MASEDEIGDLGILGLFLVVVLFLFIIIAWVLIVLALINFIWRMINKSGKKTTSDYVWIFFGFFLLFVLLGGLGLFGLS